MKSPVASGGKRRKRRDAEKAAAELAADEALGRLMSDAAQLTGDAQEQLRFLSRRIETWSAPEQELAFPETPTLPEPESAPAHEAGSAPEDRAGSPARSTDAEESVPATVELQADTTARAQPLAPPAPAAPLLPEAQAPAEAAEAAKSSARQPKPLFQRWVKTLIALLLALVIGWMPMRRLLSTTSAEATVNARIVTVRAPIDGQIAPYTDLQLGTGVALGDHLFGIADRRANQDRVNDLKRTIAETDAEVSALTERRRLLRDLQSDLADQRDRFVRGRIRQLQARVDEVGAEIAAAEARRDETKAAHERARELNSRGVQSEAVLQRAVSEATVAEKVVAAARQRLKRAAIELDAARDGVFIGENFNDIPRSQQRVDELEQQILGIGADLAERKLRLEALRSSLSTEEARYQDIAFANVTIPATGRIWEVLIAPGEVVHRGQPLVKVLDCGGTVVTAAVSEGTYNLLRIGGPASFHLRGESKEHPGRIISLNGLADATANLAIEQKALAREPYHVTVEIPGLGSGPNCNVGRTGMVTFDTTKQAGETLAKAGAGS